MMLAIETERTVLWAMSEPDFQAMYSAAIEREQAKASLQAQIAEKGRFFSRHEAKADFEYWVNAAPWAADEAVALLLGKNPDVVTWKHIQPLTKISEFALRFERLRNLAMRSKAMARGTHAKSPEQVIAWAKSIGHAIPEDLIAALETRARRVQALEVSAAISAGDVGPPVAPVAPPPLVAPPVVPAPKVEQSATQAHKLKRRADSLTAVLAEAEQKALDSTQWQSVWAALVNMAESASRPAPLMGYVEGEGVQFRIDDAEEPVRYLSREAFRSRFRRSA